MQVRCPQCTTVFSTDRSGALPCPHCGAQLQVPEQVDALHMDALRMDGVGPGPGEGEAGREPAAGLSPPVGARGPTPWERRRELGWARAWWETWRESVLRPGAFWPRVQPEAPWAEALMYGWLVALTAALLGLPFLFLNGAAAPSPEELAETMARLPPALRQLMEGCSPPAARPHPPAWCCRRSRARCSGR